MHFVREHGEQAMYRASSCARPAATSARSSRWSAHAGRPRAWVTGLRREQSQRARRGALPSTATTPGRIKFNPLANWTWADVWHYIATHDVPYNPLHDQFYPEHRLRALHPRDRLGEDFRAGRWWWEDEAAKECGLHVKTTSTQRARVVDRSPA